MSDEKKNQKPEWKKPELKKLGLMKDLVKTGMSVGKSGNDMDGMSDEFMDN